LTWEDLPSVVVDRLVNINGCLRSPIDGRPDPVSYLCLDFGR